ncbi:hypothetical protein LSAT2_020337 [Lamellibrachia satsuma]|nr:hypothetical protein LSAT2_020337 [Lamellibrachia satsuma]
MYAEQAAKWVYEDTVAELTKERDQMSATSSVERQNSANGEDMSFSHCQDTDACPLMRVNGEVNRLDECDIDRTRHWVVSQGVVLEEVVKVNKTDCTVDIDIEQERNTDITFREQGCDVMFRTEVNNKTDHAEETDTVRKYAEGESDDKLADVLKKFEEHCNPRQNTTYERYWFQCTDQEAGETGSHCPTEYLHTAESCGFANITTIIRDRFVHSMGDSKVRERLFRDKYLTLERAYEMVQATEANAFCSYKHAPKQCPAYGKECREWAPCFDNTESDSGVPVTLFQIDSGSECCVLPRHEYVRMVGDRSLARLRPVKNVIVTYSEIDESVRPVVYAQRRVPVPVHEKVRKKPDELVCDGVLTLVTEATDWVSSMVIVQKPSGQFRICIYPKDLNTAIIREYYPLPSKRSVLG